MREREIDRTRTLFVTGVMRGNRGREKRSYLKYYII